MIKGMSTWIKLESNKPFWIGIDLISLVKKKKIHRQLNRLRNLLQALNYANLLGDCFTRMKAYL